MRTRHWVRTPSMGFVALLAACGGGGPGVQGPEALVLFDRYSGTWVLNEESSEEVPAMAQPGARGRGGGDPFGGAGRRGGAAGGRRGGGGRGGGAGGRGGPGGRGGGAEGRGGGGGGVNPEAIRATMALARSRPRRIELELTDSTFAATYARGRRTEVPMNGDQVELELATWPTKAKVEWNDRIPRLKWSLDDGGVVRDRYELVAEDRLLLTRVVDLGFGGDVEVRFVYDRERGG